MKILYVSPAYKPAFNYGGPVASVSAAAEQLVRKGHQVTVLTTNTNVNEDVDVPLNQPVDICGVEVWYFARHEPVRKWLPFLPYLAQSSGFLYSPDLKKRLHELLPEVDVVHTQLPFNYPYLIGGKSAVQFRKPLFCNQRGDYHPNRLAHRGVKKKVYLKLFEMPFLRKAHTLIALTQAERDSFRALGLRNHIEIIPNGVDTDSYSRDFDPDAIQEFGIPDDATVVLFLARLHPIKGADRLIEAFLQVSEKFPKALLVMAGPDERGLRAEYQERILQSGHKDRVIFTGMVRGAQKKSLLGRADLFCLPSHAEGFSMSILEALASATPVLISPGCSFPEVQEAGAGVISPIDADSLAQALSRLLEKPELLADMGQKGLELVKARYTWDAISDELIRVYSQSLQKA